MAAMTALALGLALGGAALSAASQHKSGKAQQKAAIAEGEAERLAGLAAQRAAESQAELAEFNASVAELQVVDAEQRGRLEEERIRQTVKSVISSQRAGYAAGNIDVGYGSPVDVAGDTALVGELDALTVRTNARRQAWGFRVEATDLRTRAAITRQEGANAAAAGVLAAQTAKVTGDTAARLGTLGAISTIANGAGSLLLQKYGYGKSGKKG